MKMFLKMSILLLCSHIISAETNIKLAAVIYRHGDRTPVETYPTDPWKNESLWPVKFGELTNNGKKQHYLLGKWLRTRYSHLLSEEFEPTEIYVKSTDVDRTLMSAEANLAGMYPPTGRYIWDSHLMWQPIPVHTTPERKDEVLAMKKPCPAYDLEMSRYMNSEIYKKKLEQYKSLMEYLTFHTGKNITTLFNIMEIYNILYIESLYNFTLPDWTRSVYPQQMKEPACDSFTTAAATPLLARLKGGPLLKEIVSKMVQVSNDITYYAHNVYIYSAHDFTIGVILTALGLFDGDCPVYTSAIFMELLQDTDSGTHHIRISYRNSVNITEPRVLPIPDCGTTCPLETFVELYSHLLSVDFNDDCRYSRSIEIMSLHLTTKMEGPLKKLATRANETLGSNSNLRRPLHPNKNNNSSSTGRESLNQFAIETSYKSNSSIKSTNKQIESNTLFHSHQS